MSLAERMGRHPEWILVPEFQYAFSEKHRVHRYGSSAVPMTVPTIKKNRESFISRICHVMEEKHIPLFHYAKDGRYLCPKRDFVIIGVPREYLTRVVIPAIDVECREHGVGYSVQMETAFEDRSAVTFHYEEVYGENKKT